MRNCGVIKPPLLSPTRLGEILVPLPTSEPLHQFGILAMEQNTVEFSQNIICIS